MVIAPHTVVRFDYTLTDDSGKVLDTSSGKQPLAYLHGIGAIIPGLEAQMAGKQAGESFKATIPPEQAYGNRIEQFVQRVPRSQFPAGQLIMIGQQFEASAPNGQKLNVRVTKVDASEVELDANHPLAGKTLHFDVTIVDVRAASMEEIEHGHAHGEGGHQH